MLIIPVIRPTAMEITLIHIRSQHMPITQTATTIGIPIGMEIIIGITKLVGIMVIGIITTIGTITATGTINGTVKLNAITNGIEMNI
jgi:hypothetical protein